MDAMKFLSEAKRMCNNAGPCNTCDANEFCGFTSVFPRDFGEVDQLQKMVKLVEKWAEEHPRKTRQSEFLKQWPAARLDERGVLSIKKSVEERYCKPCKVEGKDYSGCLCRACWVDDMLDEVDCFHPSYVAPVMHGRWETNSDRPDTLICSMCKCGFDMWKHDPHNYCPNCGAKMDRGAENG